MILHKTELPGLLLVDLEVHADERGWFYEGFNVRQFNLRADQVNFSMSARKGTFRGLHYQAGSAAQTKLVFAVRGRALDVVVDVRPESPTYLKSMKFELHPDSGKGVFVPPGFAHGWLSLEENSQIIYLVEGAWSKADERGLRYDDKALDLKFPMPVTVVSPRDAEWPVLPSQGP